MTQVAHKKSETRFIKKIFNEKYEIAVPHFQRPPSQDDNLLYEPLRCESMAKHLKRGDVLFDIGTSDGWLSALYAQIVGGDSMCLFEPAAPVWTTIKSVWDANGLATPRSTFWGFVCDNTQLIPTGPIIEEGFLEYKDGWPLSAYMSEMREEMCFRSLLSTGNNIPRTTIDSFVERTGVIPRAMSMDVEGAELLVLRGSKQTMLKYHPLIWLSLHDISGSIDYDFHTTKEEIFGFLKDCGYKLTWLENYGDSHWFCE